MLTIVFEALFALIAFALFLGFFAFILHTLRLSLLLLPIVLMPTKEMIRRSNATEARRRCTPGTTYPGSMYTSEDEEYDARRHH